MNYKEIDGLVAEKVMGWELGFNLNGKQAWFDGNAWRAFNDDFQPSTNIQDAWLVVEKIKPLGLFKLSQSLEGYWWAEISGYRAYNNSAPLAICLAALKSVGVEVEGC